MRQQAALYTNDEKKPDNFDKFTDHRDGEKYKLIDLSNGIWFLENFRFNIEGSVLPDKNNHWRKSKTDYPNNVGRLYTWHQALAACPKGWKLPTKRDWISIIESGEIEKLNLIPTCHYNSKTNSYGAFCGWENKACWTSSDSFTLWQYLLPKFMRGFKDSAKFFIGGEISSEPKYLAFSVRYMRNH